MLVLVAAPCALLLAGCGTTQSTLAPESHAATDIANLFWWTMGFSWFGLAVVCFLLGWSWKRRNKWAFRGQTGALAGERAGWIVVVGAGIIGMIVLVVILYVIGDVLVIRVTEAPAANATTMTIKVVGHQWWWEVDYPGTTAVTANEIHIPVDTAIRVDVNTVDVIHSFWVPQLNRKIDTIPGRDNAIEFYATKTGRYRGQCTEYCGLQHAHMSLYVFVQTKAAYRRWLANEEKPARKPATALERQGLADFLGGPCANCHTIRGTSAGGYVGPDLTHVGSRTTLAALTIPNTPGEMGGWIANPQEIKPGNQMPDLTVKGDEIPALVAYLESLE